MKESGLRGKTLLISLVSSGKFPLFFPHLRDVDTCDAFTCLMHSNYSMNIIYYC